MRNLTDEQANELARELVIDHLRDGIEFIAVAEHVDQSMDDDDEATDDDRKIVSEAVKDLLLEMLHDSGLENT